MLSSIRDQLLCEEVKEGDDSDVKCQKNMKLIDKKKMKRIRLI